MQRYCTLKSEVDRLDVLNRCFGRVFGPQLLDDRDRLCRAHPVIEPFLSDIVLAAAMDQFNLVSASLEAAPYELMLQIVAWAHVALPQQTSLPIGDFLEPGLGAMARTVVGPSGVAGLPHTLLMAALHQLDPGVTSADELLRWYYLDAVPRHRLHRCVGAGEVAALNKGRPERGMPLLSMLDEWALERTPGVKAKLNLRDPRQQPQAREAAWEIREADPVFDYYYLPYRPRADRVRQEPVTFAGAGLDPLVADTYRAEVGGALYFGTGRSGNSLLLAEEWGIEQEFAWSLAPVATLVFSLDRRQGAARSFGFTVAPYAAADTLGQTLTVFLNGVAVLSAAVGDLLGRDAVVADNPPFVPGVNLLQFAVDIALVPAQQFGTHDTRSLGVALRRVWVA